MQENEDETISFLMIENQIRAQQQTQNRPENFIRKVLEDHTAQTVYDSVQIADIMTKIGELIEQETAEFWQTSSFEEIVKIMLHMISGRAKNTTVKLSTSLKEKIMGVLAKMVQQ